MSNHRAVDLIAATALTSRIERIAARMKDLELRIDAGSQLGAFMTRHERFAAKEIGVSIGPDADISALGQGGRHFFELEIVTEELLARTPDPLVVQKLETALGGNPLPGLDRNSLARDTMYELLLGALLQRWGAGVAFKVTPDMIATIDGQDFGLEAKRLTSAEQLPKRLSAARRQLEKVPLPGLVALSVDRLPIAGHPTPSELRISGASIDAVVAQSQGLAGKIFDKRLRGRANPKLKPPICALLVTATVQADVPSDNSIGIVTSHQLGVVPGAKATHRQGLESFFGRVYETIGSEGRLQPDR